MADIELSVGLQQGSANTSQIKAELESMLKGISGSKATKINIEPVISSNAFKGFQTQLTTSLNSISQSAAETTSALQQVSQVIQEINGKNFNINLNLDKTSLNADQVDRYKESVMDYAKSYQEAFKELARLQNAGAFKGSASGKSNGALYEYQSQFSEIIRNYDVYIDRVNDINKRMSSVKTLTGAGTVAKDFQQYWNNVIPILEKANSLGISNFDLSKFKFPEVPKDLAQTATQMSGIFDQIAPGFKQSIEEMKTMLQSAVEEINSGLSNIGKGASTDGMKQAAESVKSATESAASSINAEKQALDQVIPSKSQVAAKEAEVAAQSQNVATSAQSAAASIKVETNALDDQNDLYAKRITNYDKNGQPVSRSTLYLGNSQGDGPGYTRTVRQAYRNGTWETLNTGETHSRIQQYSSAVKEWADTYLEYLKVQDKIGKLEANKDRFGDPNGFIQSQINYLQNGPRGANSLQGYLNMLEQELHVFDDLEVGSEKFEAALGKMGKAIRDYTAKQMSYNHGENMVAGTTDFLKSASAVQNLQKQVQDAMVNWSAAKNGKSASDYAQLGNLNQELSTLYGNLSNMSKEQFATEISRIATSFGQLEASIRGAGENHKSFFAQLTDFGSMFRMIVTPMRVAMAAVRAFKQAVKSSIELQNSLVELQIVTGASNKEFGSYTKDVINSAKEIGVATKDMVTATTTYSRLGYSFGDANELAKYTTMLQKVGGIEAEDAQNAITAILKAFPDDANLGNIESVMDKLVTVGNNFPISVSQIAEGMNNASSTLAAAGNSFEQSVALLTAANTTIQNASRSSTGLRTITARLRNTTADLEELGETDFTKSKYQELVQALTKYKVSLKDINGEYRSTYDIMHDLADVWGELGTQERAALATAIAGTRQQDVLNSLLSNFKEATGAMERMSTSQGALSEAYDVYLQSITAHINQFKASFDGLGISVLNGLTPLINAIIDVGSAIMNVVAMVTNTLSPILQFVGNTIGTIISGIGSLIKGIANLATSASAAKMAVFALGAALASVAVILQSASMKTLFFAPHAGAFLGIVAALSAISSVAKYINSLSLENVSAQVAEAQSAYDRLNDKITENKARIQELEAIKGTSNWSLQLDTERASLEAENKVLETQLKIQKDLLENRQEAERTLARKTVNKAVPTGPKWLQWGASLEDTALAYRGIKNDPESTKEDIKNAADALAEYIDRVKDARESLDPTEDAEYIARIDEALARVYEILEVSVDSVSEATENAVDNDIKAIEGLSVVIERAQNNIKDLASAFDESFSATGMTAESVSTVTKIFKDIEGFNPNELFEMTALGVRMNTDELHRLNEQYVAIEKQNLIDSIQDTSRQLREVEDRLKNLDKTAEDYSKTKEELEKQRDTFESDIQGARAAYAEISALTSAYNEFLQAKSRGSRSDPYADIKNSYKEVQDRIKRGWVNDEYVSSYLDTLLGRKGEPGGRTGDNVKDAKRAKKKIKGTDYSLLDFFTVDKDGKQSTEGIDNFVKALYQLKKAGKIPSDVIKKLGDNEYALDFSKHMDEVLEATGMGYDALLLLGQAMQDANWDVDFDSVLEQINTLKETASGDGEDGENLIKLKFDTQGCDTTEIESIIKSIDGVVSVTLGVDEDGGEFLTVATQAENIGKVISEIGENNKIKVALDMTGLVGSGDGADGELADLQKQLLGACGESGIPVKLNIEALNTQTEGGMQALRTFFQNAEKVEVPVQLHIDDFSDEGEEDVAAKLKKVAEVLGIAEGADVPVSLHLSVEQFTGEGNQVKTIEEVLGIANGVDIPVTLNIDELKNDDGAITALDELYDYASENKVKIQLDLTSFMKDGGDLRKLNDLIEGVETGGIKLTISKAEGYDEAFDAIVNEIKDTPGVVTVSANEDEASFEVASAYALAKLAELQAAANIKVGLTFGDGGDGGGEGSGDGVGGTGGTEDPIVKAKEAIKNAEAEIESYITANSGFATDPIASYFYDEGLAALQGKLDAAKQFYNDLLDSIFKGEEEPTEYTPEITITPEDKATEYRGEELESPPPQEVTQEVSVEGKVNTDQLSEDISKATEEATEEVADEKTEVEKEVQVEFELSDKQSRKDAKKQIDELTDGQPSETEYEVKISGLDDSEQDLNALAEKFADMPGVTTAEVTDNGTALSVKGNIDTLHFALDQLPTHKTITISFVQDGAPPQFASGTKNAPGGMAIVNEEGPEIISDNGRAYIANGGKPALVNLSKGAIVLNADETKEALGRRGLNKPVNAYAKGSALDRDLAYIGNGSKNPGYTAVGTLSNVKGGGSGGGYGGGGNKKEEEEKREKIDWIEVAVDRIERAIDDLADAVASSFKTLAKRLSSSVDEVIKIQEEIALAEQGAARYFKEADSVGLSNALKEKAKNGTIDIKEYDKDTADKINEYLKWYEKGLDLQQKVAELHENIAEIYQDRFDMVQDDYESQLDQLEHQIEMQEKNVDMVSARGYLESTKFYEAMTDIESKRLSMLKSEMTDLKRYMDEAIASGEIDEGSEAWYEMSQEIDEVAESIAEANIQLVEYEKTMRTIRWDTFDYAIERFEQLSDEAEFFIDLMSNDILHGDDGQLTDAGMATLGMHALNFDAFMQKADEYAKELENINKMLEADPYDTALIERREELLSLQRDAISAAEDEKNAVQDLVSEGVDKELEALKELIDAYKESLDSAKDLYDYQQKLAEKSADIASIQKQLSAYAGDNSEENRSRIQKLQQDLEKAQKELQEEERDHAIEDQKKILDDLYEEYEDLLNKRIDDVNKIMQDMIDLTNEHMAEIKDKIDTVAAEVGYTVSEGMTVALDGMFAYYDQMFKGVTSVSKVLDGIYNIVGAMAEASGAIRAYSSGGIVDYTGLAMLHGSPWAPEMVLNPSDTERFLQLVSAMHSIYDVGDVSSKDIALKDTAGAFSETNIGSINLGISIDHVQDYNDFVTQLRDDPKFEKLIHAMTLDQALGKSALGKNKINF